MVLVLELFICVKLNSQDTLCRWQSLHQARLCPAGPAVAKPELSAASKGAEGWDRVGPGGGGLPDQQEDIVIVELCAIMPVSLLWQIVASISGISRCLSCFPRCTTCYFIVLSLMEQPRNQGTARTKGDRSHHFMVRTNLCVHTRKSQRCTPMSHNRSSMFLVWCVKKKQSLALLQ